MRSNTIVGIFVSLFLLSNLVYATDCTKKGTEVVKGEKVCTPQCVDFVKCHLGFSHTGYANEWWNNPPSGYHKHENGKSSQEPKKNDIFVYSIAPYGHVSVVTNIDEKHKTLTVAQTNMDYHCSYSEDHFTYKEHDHKYTVNDPKIIGWLSK